MILKKTKKLKFVFSDCAILILNFLFSGAIMMFQIWFDCFVKMFTYVVREILHEICAFVVYGANTACKIFYLIDFKSFREFF